MRGRALWLLVAAAVAAGCGGNDQVDTVGRAPAATSATPTTSTQSEESTSADGVGTTSPLSSELSRLGHDPAGVAELEANALKQAGLQLYQGKAQAAKVAQVAAAKHPISADLWQKWVASVSEAGAQLADAQQVADRTAQFWSVAAQEAKTKKTAAAKQIRDAFTALVRRQTADRDVLAEVTSVVGTLTQQLTTAQQTNDVSGVDPQDARTKISQSVDALSTLQQRMDALRHELATAK